MAKGRQAEVPSEGYTRSLGVTLKDSEIDLLGEIADEHEVSRNSVIRYGIRYFLRDYLSGEVDLSADVEEPERPRKTLNMP